MYEILHGDQVIVRDENIDLYLAVLKGGFISILRDTFILSFTTAADLKGGFISILLDLCKGNWRFSEYFIYIVMEMLEYHIKDVETGITVDVLDNVFPKDVFSKNTLDDVGFPEDDYSRIMDYFYNAPYLGGFYVLRNFKSIRLDDNIRRTPRYYYDLKPGQLKETYGRIIGVAPKKYNDLNLISSHLPKVLKDLKKEPWYYTDDLIDGFKRYATYYKDELIGRSNRPFSHILKKMTELYYGGADWVNKKKRLEDIYIKDLLSGEVLNDYRGFNIIYKNYDWDEEDLGNDGWDGTWEEWLNHSGSCSASKWFERYESIDHRLTKWDITIISKEFDWSQKYGSQINEE